MSNRLTQRTYCNPQSATRFGYVKPSSGLTILCLQLHFPVLYGCIQT